MKNIVKQLWIIAIAAAIVIACSDSPFSAEKGSAAIPVITVQPRGAEYNVGAEAVALTVTASVSDGGTLSYQWYSNTNDSNKNGTKISDGIDESYTPSTADEGVVYYYVVVTNTLNGKTAGVNSNAAKITVTGSGIVIPETEYTIEISVSGNVDGDTVTVLPDTGKAGDTVTLTYAVANTKINNLLDFGGLTTAIASVDSAGSGTRTYTINAADASSDVITITAIFTHTDLEPDPIAFTGTAGHITKTYGDAAFNNAVVTEYSGSGAITYSSSDTTVAAVNSEGQVTILKAGSAIITAEKAADAVYAQAQTEYTLAVNPKPVTIIGLSAANKQYDGTTTATVTGTATISGKVGSDDVTASGIAAFTDALVGNGKTVTFSGWSLGGADAGNYSLSAQPASVTANILHIPIEVVQIPAGTFIMGSPTSEPNRQDDETQHLVTLNGFYMGKYQVTQEQYQAVMGINPSYHHGGSGREPAVGEIQGKRPVELVTWYDAVEFCNKLSTLDGRTAVYTISGRTPASEYPITNATVTVDFTKNGYRLPTEAEWEYACRAGTTTAYNTGATISDNTGWYTTSNSERKTHEVGLKPSNAWGLYDMHGNVREWCWDWYGDYASGAQTNPTGAPSGSYRMERGGDWYNDGRNMRSAFRGYGNPSVRSNVTGFRLVRQ
jgi:formylglycine-generating enzyme required for sulfatase activity